jgi:UDP-glucose 4-epimerase
MKKNRIIILGSGGFISQAVENILKLKYKKYIALPRKKIDLTKISDLKKLKKIINNKDIIFFVAARAPVKNLKMFEYNIQMMINFCKTFSDTDINKIIYISSDAVYSDSKKKLKESDLKEPNNWHGLMHIVRENILKNNFSYQKLLILRPTLVYGKNDPHNGYGPNKFNRDSKLNKKILIFGKGEELRDHIWINDLSQIIFKLVTSKNYGEFNLSTGKLISFSSIAETINKDRIFEIIYLKRQGKMPHNGYRPISNHKIKKLFPSFKFKTVADVLNKI